MSKFKTCCGGRVGVYVYWDDYSVCSGWTVCFAQGYT